MPQGKKAQIGTVGVLFWLLSLFMAFSGISKLSEATVGVGLIALACYLGILARIAQASFISNRSKTENEGE